MTPNDIAVHNPARVTQGKLKRDDKSGRSIGPESETRGGPEAPNETLDAPGDRGKNATGANVGAIASDPPFPPGQPPVLPDPEPLQPPTPIEEPPRPLPIPPNDPPPPIIAISDRSAVLSRI